MMSRSEVSGFQRDLTSLKIAKTESTAPNSGASGSAVRFSASENTGSGLSFSNPNFAGDGGAAMADSYKEFDRSDTSPIVPEIRISNYSFRIREVILAVVSVVALVGCLILIALVASNGSDDAPTTGAAAAQSAIRTLCTEPACLRAASYGVSNMNISVNPCDNFHEYACGMYPVLNPLNPDTTQRTIFYNLYYDNQDKLRTILESAPVRTSAWSAEKKIKDFFMSCLDDYGKMKAGGKAFVDKIIQPLGGWDVLNTFDASNFNMQSNLEKTSIDFWTAALFTFRVATDRYDTTNRVIEVDMSGMGMSWAYFTRPSTEQVRQDYKKFMRQVAQLLARDSGLTLDPNTLANKIETFVNDAYDLEFQLANITANTVPTGDPHNHEKRISISDLTSQTNNVVDFVSFFNYMFGNNVNGGTRIILREDDWLRRVLAMVAAIPEGDKARKLQNYMIWRLAQSYATELSWEYIHASREFFVDQYGYASFLGTSRHCFILADRKFPDALGSLFIQDHFADKNKEQVHRKLNNYFIWRLARKYAPDLSWDYIHAGRTFNNDVTGRTDFSNNWLHCFYHAKFDMDIALGSLFAKLHFADQNKPKAEEIVSYVKQVLIEGLDSNVYMDDATRATAKAKLTAATDKMGYPDIYMNDAEIDNIYQAISINRSDYFQNLLNLNAFEKTDWNSRLTSGEDKSRWVYNSYDTTMTFYNSWNQLLVPAGLLQFPVYEWTMPHYFNFGSMGGLVGHYLVHAVDNWGSFYDANGVYGNWYSNASRNAYRQLEQCYAGAFQNKTMGPFNIVGQSAAQAILVNGQRFAWEGLAITSGVRAAYKAYKRWVADKGEEKPTPTPHYTNDQSFFLAFAQTNCYTRTDALGYYYAQIQRVPEDIRTNTALSLLDEFTKAFNCPASSPMNSATKCDTF